MDKPDELTSEIASEAKCGSLFSQPPFSSAFFGFLGDAFLLAKALALALAPALAPALAFADALAFAAAAAALALALAFGAGESGVVYASCAAAPPGSWFSAA